MYRVKEWLFCICNSLSCVQYEELVSLYFFSSYVPCSSFPSGFVFPVAIVCILSHGALGLIFLPSTWRWKKSESFFYNLSSTYIQCSLAFNLPYGALIFVAFFNLFLCNLILSISFLSCAIIFYNSFYYIFLWFPSFLNSPPSLIPFSPHFLSLQ